MVTGFRAMVGGRRLDAAYSPLDEVCTPLLMPSTRSMLPYTLPREEDDEPPSRRSCPYAVVEEGAA